MPNFKITARDPSGHEKHLTITAKDRYRAIVLAKEQGFLVLGMEEARAIPKPTKINSLRGIALIILVVSGFLCLGYFLQKGFTYTHELPEKNLQKIYDKVAKDAVARYHIVEVNGTAMEKCVQAGLVAAAYLQAKNAESYESWKGSESMWCALVGMEFNRRH